MSGLNFFDLITSTRSGTATRVNAAGLIETVSANTPRFDYDPVTLAALGLLSEEARTNLLAYSVPTNANWVNNSLTGVDSYGVAPDGTTTTYKTVNPTVGTRYQPFSVTNAVVYTVSYFLKRPADQAFRIFADGTPTPLGTGAFAIFNGTTLTVSSSAGIISARAYPWSPSVIRVEMTFTALATGTANAHLYPADGVGVYEYWGFQAEAGYFATSHIPTAGATVTRSADNAMITGANFASWYNQSEGTIFVEGSTIYPNASAARFLTIDDGSGANRVADIFIATNLMAAYNGFNTLNMVSSSVPDTILRGALAYKSHDYQAAGGGSLGGSDTASAVHTPTEMSIGHYVDGSLSLNGHIRSIKYWPRRLSNAELMAITA